MCRMHECRGGHGWPRAAPERLAEIAPKRFRGLRPVGANAPPPKTLARFVELKFSSSSRPAIGGQPLLGVKLCDRDARVTLEIYWRKYYACTRVTLTVIAWRFYLVNHGQFHYGRQRDRARKTVDEQSVRTLPHRLQGHRTKHDRVPE